MTPLYSTTHFDAIDKLLFRLFGTVPRKEGTSEFLTKERTKAETKHRGKIMSWRIDDMQESALKIFS